jgi:hypothetical protein
MGNVVNRSSALKSEAESRPANSEAARRREEIFQDIKLALVTAELTLDEPRRGFDPYNAKLGSSPRDVWNRSGRQR